MEYIRSKLEKYVKLNKIKTIKQQNKKVISTCVYIPGELEYNVRTIYYFQGLVKSVETFQEVMNKNDGNWIYRIYYDNMFDKGINFSYKKKNIKHMTKKQKKLEKKRRKLLSRKKKQAAKDMGSIGNEFDYAFDTSAYNMPHEDMNKIFLLEDESTKRLKSSEKVKKNIIENEENFKKLLKLYHLYLKSIKQNKHNKYQNIELISYNCPRIKKHPQFIGHNSSFGMFLRFCPILDSDVKLFYSVNSTHPITPQLAHIINEWSEDTQKDSIAFCYETVNIVNSSYKYIIKNVENIKQKDTKDYTTFDKKFIEIINNIFKLNSLTEYHKSLFILKKNNRTVAEKIADKMKQDRKLTFDKIKKCNSRSSELSELNKNLEPYFRKEKIKDKIKYSYKNLIINKKNYLSSSKNVIGGGAFGFKKTFPLLKERYSVFIDFIVMLLEHKIQLEYGIDELLLKIILLPDIFIYNNDFDKIKVVFLTNVLEYCDNNILKLLEPDKSFLSDRNGNKIIIKPDFYNKINLHLKDFFYNSWISQLDHYDTRGMFIKENNSKLKEYEDINLTISLDTQLCFNTIFIGYNEPKKLLLIDKKLDTIFFLNKKLKKYLDMAFNVHYIQDYNLGKIDKLLEFLISYYRTNVKHPNIIFTQTEKKSISSNSSLSEN